MQTTKRAAMLERQLAAAKQAVADAQKQLREALAEVASLERQLRREGAPLRGPKPFSLLK